MVPHKKAKKEVLSELRKQGLPAQAVQEEEVKEVDPCSGGASSDDSDSECGDEALQVDADDQMPVPNAFRGAAQLLRKVRAVPG